MKQQKKPNVSDPVYLYVIGPDQNGKPVKLGISKDPEHRLRQLQTGHAQRLKLYHQEPVPAAKARQFESLLHKAFNHKRTHGEWFDMTPDEGKSCVQFILIEHEESDLIP